jgi:Skp family chaperone for outer membrane proteins
LAVFQGKKFLRGIVMRSLLMVLALLAVGVTPGFAQQATQFPIAVLDTDTVLGTSLAGRSLDQQLRQIQQQMVQEIQAEDQAIQQEGRRLAEASQGQTREQLLSNTQLTQQIAANDRRAAALRQRIQSNERDFLFTRQTAVQEFNRQLTPVISQVMEARGAALVVDASVVVQSVSAIDITQDVVARLDQASPTIRVTRQTAPPPAQPPGQAPAGR